MDLEALKEIRAWADSYQGRAVILAAELADALEASQARVKELEAALAFYADQNNWDAGFGIPAEELAFSSIGHDWGEKARAALGITESDMPSGRD